MVEIYSKSLVKTHKCDEKWPLFVNKQVFWWSASVTLDNNNGVLTDFTHLSQVLLYHIPQWA